MKRKTLLAYICLLSSVFLFSYSYIYAQEDTSFDRAECIRLGNLWDEASAKCLPKLDTSFERAECIRNGLVWDSLLQKCTSQSNAQQMSGVVPGGGSSASPLAQNQTLNQFLSMVAGVVKMLVPLLVGIAVLAFFWYLIKFIWYGKEDAEAKKIGASGMAWSILALFVMVSIWGIIGLLGNVTGIQQGGSIHGFIAPGKQK